MSEAVADSQKGISVSPSPPPAPRREALGNPSPDLGAGSAGAGVARGGGCCQGLRFYPLGFRRRERERERDEGTPEKVLFHPYIVQRRPQRLRWGGSPKATHPTEEPGLPCWRPALPPERTVLPDP